MFRLSEKEISFVTAVAFFFAWVMLVAAVAVLAAKIDGDVLETKEAVRTVEQITCGAWLGTYQFLNVWAESELTDREAVAIRTSFAADFRANCPNYVQTIEDAQ